MAERLAFHYDRGADILYISTRTPYPEQQTEALGDDVVARLNPVTGEVENLEMLFFSARLEQGQPFELPIAADLRLSR